MGHLFTQGGKIIEGDGVRHLYIGSLGHVPSDIFATTFDYVALGHLHIPQQVGPSRRIFYSGSPIPMGFGEAGQTKSVCLIETSTPDPPRAQSSPHSLTSCAPDLTVRQLPIPVFQTLQRIFGDLSAIATQIHTLRQEHAQAWLEVTYTGKEVVGDLRERLTQMIAGSQMEVLIIRNQAVRTSVAAVSDPQETLDDLDHMQVFEKKLLTLTDHTHVQKAALRQTYKELQALMLMAEGSESA